MGTNHEDTHINESILSEEILEDQKKNRIDHMTYLPGMEDIGSEILDQVVTAMEAYDYNTYTAEDVKRALAHSERTPEDFQALLSPAALPFLEEIAQAAQIETKKHFGNSVYMFTPIYIANYCENYCIYCGFNCHNKIRRAKLDMDEIEQELKAIAETGLQEILILTGESRAMSPVSYIGEAVKLARKYFRVIGIEIYPLNVDEYAYLHECGVDYVTVPLLAVADVSASSFLLAKYNIGQFFSRTPVKIITIVVVLLIIAVLVWFRLYGRTRRYGRSGRRYRHHAYRGRRR